MTDPASVLRAALTPQILEEVYQALKGSAGHGCDCAACAPALDRARDVLVAALTARQEAAHSQAPTEQASPFASALIAPSVPNGGDSGHAAPVRSSEEGAPAMTDLEMELRTMYWLGHGHVGVYGDDGEMQCSECMRFGMWDYKREPLEKVRATFNAVKLERAATGTGAWQPRESAPQDGTPFHAYGATLVDVDFNPCGVVEACFDGERFIGAIWNGQHDIWNTLPIEFSQWRRIEPPAPSSERG